MDDLSTYPLPPGKDFFILHARREYFVVPVQVLHMQRHGAPPHISIGLCKFVGIGREAWRLCMCRGSSPRAPKRACACVGYRSKLVTVDQIKKEELWSERRTTIK